MNHRFWLEHLRGGKEELYDARFFFGIMSVECGLAIGKEWRIS
jgi:hypothetical protein